LLTFFKYIATDTQTAQEQNASCSTHMEAWKEQLSSNHRWELTTICDRSFV